MNAHPQQHAGDATRDEQTARKNPAESRRSGWDTWQGSDRYRLNRLRLYRDEGRFPGVGECLSYRLGRSKRGHIRTQGQLDDQLPSMG